MTRLKTRLIALATVVLLPTAASVVRGQQPNDVTVITGATVIDVTTTRSSIEGAVVVLDGNRISRVSTLTSANIPAGAQVIDARGKFLIPGLADMHNHSTDNLGQLLGWGITTVFSTGTRMQRFAEIRAIGDDGPTPRFFSVGPLLTAPNGWASWGYTPETPGQARMAVRELKTADVDAVKLVYDDMSWLTTNPFPVLDREVMTAIIDEAHRVGLRAYVHAPVLQYAKEALRAGADGFVHGIISDPVDGEFVALMQERQAVYTATLALFEACADLAAWVRRQATFDEQSVIPREVYDGLRSPENVQQWEARWNRTAHAKEQLATLRQNLTTLSRAGVLIVTGTDTPVPGVLPGVSSQMELLLHVEAGLDPVEAIRAATLNAARMMGREGDLGSVEAGKLADLLILDMDPRADIRNIRRIYRVIKGGVVYDPAQLLRPQG